MPLKGEDTSGSLRHAAGCHTGRHRSAYTYGKNGLSTQGEFHVP